MMATTLCMFGLVSVNVSLYQVIKSPFMFGMFLIYYTRLNINPPPPPQPQPIIPSDAPWWIQYCFHQSNEALLSPW
jgi:hypothetical protein